MGWAGGVERLNRAEKEKKGRRNKKGKGKGNEYPPKCAQLKKFIRLITICKTLLPGQTYETKHGENTEGIIAHFLGGLEEEH